MKVEITIPDDHRRGLGRVIWRWFVPVLLCLSILMPGVLASTTFGAALVHLCPEPETCPEHRPANEDDLVETAKAAGCALVRRGGRETPLRPYRFEGHGCSRVTRADLLLSLSRDSQNLLPDSYARRNGVGACLRL